MINMSQKVSLLICIIIGIVLITLTGILSIYPHNTSQETEPENCEYVTRDAIAEQVNKMSLGEKIGQMLIPEVYAGNSDSFHNGPMNEKVKRLI